MEKTTILNNEILKKTVRYVAGLAIITLLAKAAILVNDRKIEYDKTRTASICPALLSISRSARDTLIVMKAEPLCNNYVLTNLK
jgi:hypothetical protein